MGRRLADLFHGRPRLALGALLAGPIGWLVIGYIGSLVVMLVAAFWRVDALSGEVSRTLTLDNFKEIVETPGVPVVTGRTVGIAAAATLTDALLAFPIAFAHGEVASPRMKGLLVVAILMPLWSFYLVKVYAWRTMLSEGGDHQLGARAVWPQRPRVRHHRRGWSRYLWLPFMILLIYAGLERILNSLLSASEDLGAGPAAPSAA